MKKKAVEGSTLGDIPVERMKLSDLKPAEYNPRKITDKAMEGLGESMKAFGLLAPIVWNKRSGNIVGGHQRYKHLKESGETETDVVVVDLDDNEEIALNVTLNNKEIRGDFTKDVVDQLRMTEAQIGSVFNRVGLIDLFKETKHLEEQLEKTSKKREHTNDDGGGVPPVPDSNKPDALIECPQCKSRWKLKNNEVVLNTTARSYVRDDEKKA